MPIRRFILVIILFFIPCLLFSEFDSPEDNYTYSLEIENFHDKKNVFSIENPPQFDNFKKEHSLIGLKNSYNWSLITIKNNSFEKKKFFYLINFNHKIKDNSIEFLIYKNNIFTKKTISINSNLFSSLNNIIPYLILEIDPNDSIKILSLNNSQSIIQTNWIVEEYEYFNRKNLYTILIWGMYYSLIIFFLIFNITNFLITKRLIHLISSFIILLISVNFCAHNDIYFQSMFFTELYEIPSWFISSLISLLMLFFIKCFFKNKYHIKYSKYLSKLIFIQVFLLILSLNIYFINLNIYLFNFFILLIHLFLFISGMIFLVIGINIFKNQTISSLYYFIGQSLFIFIYLLQSLINAFNYTHLFSGSYILSFIIISNILFITGIVYYIKSIKNQNDISQKLLIEQSTFYILGQSTSHILHQWKIPLTKLSNYISLIEYFISNKQPIELYNILSTKLNNIKFCIEHLNSTIKDFSNLDYLNHNLKEFFPKNTVSKILVLLNSKIILTKTRIDINISEELIVYSHENIFSNIVLILLNNSLDAFLTTIKHQPYIILSVSIINEFMVITIKDNAGGIKIKPIQNIFQYFSTTKNDSNGIGLPLLKLIVEEKLHGNIYVKNTFDGVLFEIIIPCNKNNKKDHLYLSHAKNGNI